LNKTTEIISIAPSDTDPDEGEVGAIDAEVRTAQVPQSHHGERLDRALVEVAPEFSRSYLQQLIALNAVRVNGQPAGKPSSKVKAGDAISVELRPTPQSQAFKPENIELDVVYEDAHLLVINKPAGLVVHPAPGNWSGTLLNALLAHDPMCCAMPRAGIVHRLDKDTSGLMVVARTRQAMDALVNAIAAREVSRQYLAIAHKPWAGRSPITVDMPIGRDPRNRLRMAVVDLQTQSGKLAKTDVVRLANSDLGCLVQCILHTGRTHQIRVHMAHIGHPLVGDVVYGGVPVSTMVRQALHAFRLAFAHPVDGKKLSFEVAPPSDFLDMLAHWGLSYNSPVIV
jgi:23S rRNA pseudouridine1911/1915/1917 synthase